MTHWKKLTNPDYLGAYALYPGQELILTIKEVRRELVTGADGKKEECTVAIFSDGKTKPMILNSTNCKAIQKAHGTPHIEEWSGKQIQVFVQQVKAFGDVVDALRVRPVSPKMTKPDLSPSSQKWSGAVDSLRNGNTTIDAICKHYSMTEENRAALMSQANA